MTRDAGRQSRQPATPVDEVPMSIFASMVTEQCDVTDPDDSSVKQALIRRLTPKQLRLAAKASQEQAVEHMRLIGADMIKAMRDPSAVEPEAKRDPLLQFDRSVLLTHGLVSIDGEKVANVDDISDDPSETIARAILKLSKPSLFLTFDESRLERKNASGSYIVQ